MKPSFKRLMAILLSIIMVVGLLPTVVFAEGTAVASVNGTGYETFDEALAAASAMTGDVVVEIYDKVTLSTSLSGSYDSIKFVGEDADAEIYLDVQGYITASGKKVAFEDLTLSKSEGGYITNAGFMNVAFGVYDVVEVTYTNCTFANGAYASSGVVTFTACTFYRSYDKYGLWAYGNVDVTVNDSTFADYRGIKMYAEGAAKTVELTVNNTDFSAVTDKPAIVLTYGESVTLAGNKYSSTGVFELDLDGAPNGTTVTSDDAPTCVNDNGKCGVLVGGKIYTTVTDAVAVAEAGDEVILLYSTDETATFAEGVNLTLAEGVTAENVTVPGGSTGGEEDGVVAQIGDTYYTTLQAAIDAAANGAEIDLLDNITLTETVTVAADDEIILDLNGKTVSMVYAEDATANHEMLLNKGNLTIQDSVGGGKLSYTYTGASLSTTYAANTVTSEPGSVLTVKSGTIENLTYDQAVIAYAIDGRTNGTAGDVTVNIEGGTITSLRQSVRIFANSTTNTGTLNISGGVFFGRVIVQNANSSANNAVLTITGGTFNANEYKTDVLYVGGSNSATIDITASVSGGTFNGEITDTEVTGFISGGTFTTDVSEYCAGGFTCEANTDGTYGVVVDPANGYVAKIGDTYYDTLQDAIVAAAPSGTVEILSDVTVDEWIMFSETLSISSGQIITLNINGLTINGNNHTLTIKSIESAGNGNRLFYDAQNLNINNLTIEYVDDAENQGGIGLQSGTLSGVNFVGGGYGVLPGNGEITITGCEFATNSTAIYFEEERDDLTVTCCEFNQPEGVNVILLHGDVVFTDNNVVSGRTVNVVSGSPVVTGNDFNDVRLKVYTAAEATISGNEINVLAFEEGATTQNSTFSKNTLSESAQAALDAVTAPAGPIEVTTYDELLAALETDNANIKMMNDITATATQTSGYGNAGIVLDAGDILDGNGKTLTINGANNTWDCAIAMRGGEVKNLTIAGAMRGVFMPGANGDVVIDNCVFKDVIYTFNSDAGSKDYTVTIKNTTLNGWTSFSDVHKSVTFEDCSFGEGSGYAFCRPYQATTFTDCSFAEGFKLDTTQVADNALEFNGCTYAGTALSADNNDMFIYGGVVMIDSASTDVTNYPPTGSNSPAYTGEVDGNVRVWGEGSGNAKESFVLKLYSGDTLIATTTLNNVGGIIDGEVNVTWNFFYPSSNDAYWTTTWEDGHPSAGAEPTKVQLWIDGTLVATTAAQMNGPDNLNPVVWAELGGVASVIPEVIQIYDWADLKELDALVESGNMLEGVTVKLMNDIDLYEMGSDGEPVSFNPIGANSAYFKGTFDGQGHTIKNMYQSGWALGYDWNNYGTIGLFAYIWNATVKNLTIENAECFVEGGNVAGIAGCAWGNCTFENITIKNSTYATYNNRAAGIIGYTGGEGTMTFKNVTVDKDTVIAALWGSYDCNLGGVVGSTQSPTKFHFEDVTVECELDCYNDVTASYKWYSYRMCGMLIGRMTTLQEGSTDVDPCDVVTMKNVNITIGEWANQTYIWDDSLSKGCQRVEAGYTYGGVDVSMYPDAEITELGFSTIIGGPQSQSKGYYGSDITKLEALEGFETQVAELEVEDLALEIRSRVAQVDSEYFTTLQEAIDAAQAGDTITMLRDVILSETVTIASDDNITLDLNGKTITYNSTTQGEAMITNKGNLTINDTVGTGVINYNYTGEADSTYGIGNYTISNGGTLTVNGGKITIANLSGHAKYPIDNNSTTGDAILVINGGHLYNYNTSAIRQFCNSTTYKNSVTINGGLIEGYCAIWVQNPGKNTVNGSLSITGGEIRTTAAAYVANPTPETLKSVSSDIYFTISGEGGAWDDASAVSITGGIFNENVYLAEKAPASITVDETGATFNGNLELPVPAGVTGLTGSGTEADPYLISNVDELKWFREAVNAGNNYAGKYVKLNADINLAGETWTPIGDLNYDSKYAPSDDTKVFSGVFDGNKKVISNLTISKTVGDADAEANVGLFGITGAGAVIKNLTITNVDIDTDGRNVGALAGFAYKATLENITVNGNIQIKGGNNVAGVCGMTRYYAMSATNITVSGTDGSSIVGNNIVGGIFAEIAPNGSEQTFSNLSVENVAITGVGGVGGIVGLLTTGAVSNVSVKNVVLTGRTDYQGDAMGRIRLGSVAGLMGSSYATIANAAVENVTAKNLDGNAVVLPIIGANYDASSNATEAKIGDTYYAVFEGAYAAAQTGDVITLLTPIVVDAGETLTLDKTVTITYTSNVPGEDMITNKGKVVIDGATLVYTNTDTTASNVTVSTISCEPGSVLEVKSGTVKNDSANNGSLGIYAFAIDLLTNGNLGDVTATISGGDVISTNYMAIRQFNNGTACKNTLTVTGGYIYGAKRAIQVHLKNDAAYLEISGGKVVAGEGGYALCLFPETATHFSVTGGEFIGTVYSGTNGIISGGTFSYDVSEYCADGFTCEANTDGTYGVVVDPAYGKVAMIDSTYYDTLQEAIDAAQTGDTITMLGDVTLTETVTVAADDEIILDLNGKTISGTQTATLTANDALIRINKGSLTIKDSGDTGTITYGYSGEATGWSGYSASTIENNQGTLVINSGKIVSTTNISLQIAYAVNVLTNGGLGDATANINGGEIVAAGSTAVRQFANSETCTNTLEITGGKITGRVQLQSSDTKNNKGVLKISGGEIIRENNTAIEIWFAGGTGSAYSATDVKIGGNVKVTGNILFDEAPEAYNNKVISGGTFSYDVSEYCADGFTCKANEDGTYGVVEAEEVENNTITAKSATLLYEDMIQIRYKFEVTGEDIAEYGMFVFTNKDDADAHDVSKAVQHKELIGYTDGYYGYTDGIAAKEMGDSQFVVGYLKLNDGTYIYGNTVEYSPKIYAKRMIAKDDTDEKTIALCNALMNYGAAAQVKFEYKTDDLMNAGFDTVVYDESVLGTSIFSVDTTETNGFTTKAATLLFEGAITYRLKYSATSDISNNTLYLEYTVNNETNSVEMQFIGGSYYAYIAGFAPKDMDEKLEARPYYLDTNNNKVYGTMLVYSGYEYARRTINNQNSEEADVNLAKAFAMYVHYTDAALG